MTISMANNAVAHLAAPISDSATTLVLVEAEAGNFPSPTGGAWHPVTVNDGVHIEIMRVTSRALGVLTVARAQEGTSAVAFAAGAVAEIRMTAGAIADLQSATSAVAASVSTLATDVDADLTALSSIVAGKASQSSVDALSTSKANQSDLNTLSATVAGLATSKANQSDLDALSATVATKADLSAVAALATVPVGAVLEWYTDTLPTGGYIWANGAAVSRTGTTAALFALWGTTFGAGNGSTTFNVVDKRGRIGAGQDDMGGVTAAGRLTTAGSGVDGATLGATGGAQSHTLTAAQIPAHTHPITDPTHTHAISGQNVTGTSLGMGPGTGVSIGGVTATPAATGITVNNNTGGGGAHNNVQPTLVCNFIIKT